MNKVETVCRYRDFMKDTHIRLYFVLTTNIKSWYIKVLSSIFWFISFLIHYVS